MDKVIKDNNTSQDTIGNLKAESGVQYTPGAREDISQIFYSEIFPLNVVDWFIIANFGKPTCYLK